MVWFEREISRAYAPSPLGLHIADIVCPRVGLQPDVVYHSCHSALKTGLDSSDNFRDTFKTEPAVVLFCMLWQLVHRGCYSRYGWAKVPVDLPKKLRKELESLIGTIVRARTERHIRKASHLGHPVAAEHGAGFGENIQNITAESLLGSDFPTLEYDPGAKIEDWYRDLRVPDRYTAVIVDLIASVASRLPNDVLLVFDCLEQMGGVIWERPAGRRPGVLQIRVEKLVN